MGIVNNEKHRLMKAPGLPHDTFRSVTLISMHSCQKGVTRYLGPPVWYVWLICCQCTDDITQGTE